MKVVAGLVYIRSNLYPAILQSAFDGYSGLTDTLLTPPALWLQAHTRNGIKRENIYPCSLLKDLY